MKGVQSTHTLAPGTESRFPRSSLHAATCMWWYSYGFKVVRQSEVLPLGLPASANNRALPPPPVPSRSVRRHCGQWSLEWPFWPHAKQRPRKGRVPAAAGVRMRSRPATTALPHAAPRTKPACCAPRSAPSGGGAASPSTVHATKHAPSVADGAASGVSGAASAPETSAPAAHGGAARTLRPERW